MSTKDTSASGSGPGKTLLQARTALGLDPENVAQILHLSPRQIIALEQDDYGHLPEPTYVRGYLRSYAQLLGLDPENILESYKSLSESNVTINLGKLSPTPEMTSNDRLIQVSSLLVAGLIIGMVVIWWQGGDEAAQQNGVDVAVSADNGAVSGEGISSPDESLLGPDATLLLTPPEEAAQVTDEGYVEVVNRLKEKPGDTAAAGRPQAPVAAPEPWRPRVQSRIEMPEETAVVPAAEPPPALARMVIVAREDCWIDIRDARQNKLVYQTLKAGRVITVEGVPPFSVFLGNADGVTLEFNGVPYDVSKHKRGMVARFELGEAQVEAGD